MNILRSEAEIGGRRASGENVSEHEQTLRTLRQPGGLGRDPGLCAPASRRVCGFEALLNDSAMGLAKPQAYDWIAMEAVVCNLKGFPAADPNVPRQVGVPPSEKCSRRSAT
jgi:hypothetical protein